MAVKQLLSAASVSTVSDAILLKNHAHPAAHIVTTFAAGDFGSGTLKAQLSPDGTVWRTIEDGSWSGASAANFQISEGYQFRVVLSAPTNSSVDVWISSGRGVR